MTTTRQTKPSDYSKIELQARIWRAVDREAIAHRGDPLKQEAERQARRQLRSIIDSAKVAQP